MRGPHPAISSAKAPGCHRRGRDLQTEDRPLWEMHIARCSGALHRRSTLPHRQEHRPRVMLMCREHPAHVSTSNPSIPSSSSAEDAFPSSVAPVLAGGNDDGAQRPDSVRAHDERGAESPDTPQSNGARPSRANSRVRPTSQEGSSTPERRPRQTRTRVSGYPQNNGQARPEPSHGGRAPHSGAISHTRAIHVSRETSHP